MSDKLVRICNRVSDGSDGMIDFKKGEIVLDISRHSESGDLLISNGSNIVRVNTIHKIGYHVISYDQSHFNNGTSYSIIGGNDGLNLNKYIGSGSYQEYSHDVKSKWLLSINISGYSDAEFLIESVRTNISVTALHDLKLSNDLKLEPIYSLTDANQQVVLYCSIYKTSYTDNTIKIYARNVYDFSDGNTIDNFPIPNGTKVKITLTELDEIISD